MQSVNGSSVYRMIPYAQYKPQQSWAPSTKHGLASPKKKWEPIQFDPEPQWPCILENAPSTRSCSLAAGQATPSYNTSENKWWNSATTYQRECSSSKTTATFQTSNTKSPQMTRECAMIRTTPRRDEVLVVIRHGEHGSHHSRNSANLWHRQKFQG